MSEIEREKEKEEEREIVDHWSHEHPLTLVETRRGDECYGCERRFSSGEQAYGCRRNKCVYEKILHEECAKMARKIRHPMHPQHILIQQNQRYLSRCAICKKRIWRNIGYRCTSSDCKFGMHMRCAQCSGVMDAVDDDDDDDAQRRSIIHHPSHPKHEMRLWRSCSFKCDACGTTRTGKSYACTVCQYWIHHTCASLPDTMKRDDHHHSLSLSFHVPPQYLKFDYKCDVCNKYLLPKYWIYHCQLCSYAVHLKCAINKSPHTNISNAINEKDMIRLPINDVGEEQIRPFVMRLGVGAIPPIPHDEMVNMKHRFLHHAHQLTIISTSHEYQNEGEEEDGDDDYGKRSELICDGCITPIFQKKHYYYYMSCSECKYNLHMACFDMPPHLPSLPLHHQPGHDLVLQFSNKLGFEWYCSVCYLYSNGLFYACTNCNFKADIKCASLLDTIYHAAHPQHLLNHVCFKDMQDYKYSSCAAGCGSSSYYGDWYACYTCDFFLHAKCAMLPASITSRRWDKHHLRLPLRYNANLNHPGEFYCDQCEKEMNPKSWMYHCCHCDLSFHPKCFKTTSGFYRNIKLGQQYVNAAAAHPHPLAVQLLTTKRRCNFCGEDRHECLGFHCASCNFFICFYGCGEKMLQDGDIEAVN